MTLLVLLIILSLASLLFLYRVARGVSLQVRQPDDLNGKTEPVDLQAFRLLIDRQEEAFLRRNLPPRKFRKVQRARMLAAAEYVRRISANAAVLVRLGEAARHHPDEEIARAGRELVNDAVQVRMFALLAFAKIYAQAAVPGVSLNVSEMFARYQKLTEAAALLTRLQRPAYTGRLLAML